MHTRTIRMLTGAAALVAVAATLPGATAAAEQAKPKEPSVSGWGRLYFADDDHREFTFDAAGLPPRSRGTFSVAHFSDKTHKSGVRFWGRVDCLVVGGRTATFTGVIKGVESFGKGQPDVSKLKGVRRGFSVHDSGPGRLDRLGFSWFMDPGSLKSSQKCQGPAPFGFVVKGGYKTTEWLPPNVIPPR